MNKLHIVILLFILYANFRWEDALCSLRVIAQAPIKLQGTGFVAVKIPLALFAWFTRESWETDGCRGGWVDRWKDLIIEVFRREE